MEFPCISSLSPPPPSAESILPKVHFFLPSKHMAGRENWKWAVPALHRCFFMCSRVSYSNCSRCLAFGERGRREEPPLCGGLSSLPGARVLPRALSVPSAAAVLPALSPPRTQEGTSWAARFGSGGAPLTRGCRCAWGSPGWEGSTQLPGLPGSRPSRLLVFVRHHIILHISSFISPSARPRGVAPGAAATPCRAAPRDTGIRLYPGITQLSTGRLALHYITGGAFLPALSLSALRPSQGGRRAERGEPGASGPGPRKGPDAVNLPLARRGRDRGMHPAARGEGGRLFQEASCKRPVLAGYIGFRRDEAKRPRVPRSPHRGPAPRSRQAAAPRRLRPAPRPWAPPASPPGAPWKTKAAF